MQIQWKRNSVVSKVVLEAAEEVCGKIKAQTKEDTEMNKDVQEKIKIKKTAFKEWQKQEVKRGGRCIQKQKERQREKWPRLHGKWYEWYDKLETEEGERTIYKIMKQSCKQESYGRDDNNEGSITTDGEKIRERWREYFKKLISVENEREPLVDVLPTEGQLLNITEGEVKQASDKMKNRKVPGCSGLKI